MKNWVKLVLCVAACELAGAVGGLFTAPAIPAWYAALEKPWFTPPSWVFGPAWIMLYALMGVAAYLVWKKGLDKKGVKTALILFAAQLALNVSWSFLFFGLRNPFYALVEIIVLWLAIAVTAFKFWEVDKKAGYLLLPYLTWVSFAAALNYYVWLLNA